jgi:hypothetical protein
MIPPGQQVAPAQALPAPLAQPPVAAPPTAGLAGLASALGNHGFAALARRPQPMGPQAIDRPKPLLGMTGHQVLRNAVLPDLRAALVALAAPAKVTKGAIETAHANVRTASTTFNRLGPGTEDTEHPSQLDHAMSTFAIRMAEQRMDAIASGNGFAVATQALVRALGHARRGRAAAEQRDGHGGKLRTPETTTPAVTDFDADLANIQGALDDLAALGPDMAPADADAKWQEFGLLIPTTPRDEVRDEVRREVAAAQEGMALEALGLEQAVEGERSRLADAIMRVERLADTEAEVARKRAGGRDPVPDEDNPEIPHEPVPPPGPVEI